MTPLNEVAAQQLAMIEAPMLMLAMATLFQRLAASG